MTTADIKRAEQYELYINGNAYIPPQDLAFYKKSFDKVYNQIRHEEIVKSVKECINSDFAMIQREDEQFLKLLKKKLDKND